MNQDVTSYDYDVAIVGYGPVGQTLAALLGARGHKVLVVERWPELFPLPRAGHIDHEIMRILQAVDVADDIEADSWKVTGYQLVTASGEVLHSFDWGFQSTSGWYSDYSLFQPYLERLLDEKVTSHSTVDVLRGWQTERLDDTGAATTIEVRRAASTQDGVWEPSDETRVLSARYVVGCDGANSLVRESAGIAMTDFGFEADWLVVFAEPSDPSLVVDMPDVAQILDPSRPTTAFRSSGKRFCRWEFMLLPGESPEEMSTPETAWSLISRWGLNPQNASLVRNTVFRFRSLVADTWRSGNLLLAGDAAHLMPPFLGQGMCSGLRDAMTLSWKLDLVLRELAPDALLDTYGAERRDHVATIVQASLGIGELISVTDPEQAARRDASLRTHEVSPPAPMPKVLDGVLLRDAAGHPTPHAGELSVQSLIRATEGEGRSDDVLPRGWTMFTVGAQPDAISTSARAVLSDLDATVVRVLSTGQPDAASVVDLDGTLLGWLHDLTGGFGAVIVRPDFYVFGAVPQAQSIEDAVMQLARQLGLHHRHQDHSGAEILQR